MVQQDQGTLIDYAVNATKDSALSRHCMLMTNYPSILELIRNLKVQLSVCMFLLRYIASSHSYLLDKKF